MQNMSMTGAIIGKGRGSAVQIRLGRDGMCLSFLVVADGENGTSSSEAAQQLGMADIVDRMKDLAKNTGDASRRSRKDRAALRSTFKDLINVVEVRHFAPWQHSLTILSCPGCSARLVLLLYFAS